MTTKKIAQIKHFLSDVEMSETVKGVLVAQFLQRKKDADVHTLAAQTLAFQFLEDAWIEMNRYKTEAKRDDERVNVGV
jgi:hypothetical protein